MFSFRPNSEVQEAIKKTMAGTRVILWDSGLADGRAHGEREREESKSANIKSAKCS